VRGSQRNAFIRLLLSGSETFTRSFSS